MLNAANIANLAHIAASEGIHRFVVGAVIHHNRKALILRRKTNDFMPGLYELPSGKVEEKESLDVALKREVSEETGKKINEIVKYINHFDYQSKSGAVTRQFNFLVEVEEDNEKVELTEHDCYAWIKPEDLPSYNVSEKTQEVIKKSFQN